MPQNNCPKCGLLNGDNWPLKEGLGGCENCWEKECYDDFGTEELQCEMIIKNYNGAASMRADISLSNANGKLVALFTDFEFSCSKVFNRFRGTYEPIELPS